jgi:DNA adenine methylase
MIKPFLKFPGGKSYLADTIIKHFPKRFRNYHEPMVGGGALFFELCNRGMLENKQAFLSDSNTWLMHVYKTIKNEPEKVIKQLRVLKNKHNKCLEKYGSAEKFYYYVRKTINNDFCTKNLIPEASVIIYLNKTCFNGLFRFNKKGFFNAPFGKQEKAKIFSADNILAVAQVLRKYVAFGLPDYKQNVENIRKGDLIYFDPPYWPVRIDSFVSYNANGFSSEDQVVLAHYVRRVCGNKKAHVIVSNSDVPAVRKMYDVFSIYRVSAPRRINRDGKNRGKINELVITSF